MISSVSQAWLLEEESHVVWAGRSGHYPILPMRKPRNCPAMESDLSVHVPDSPLGTLFRCPHCLLCKPYSGGGDIFKWKFVGEPCSPGLDGAWVGRSRGRVSLGCDPLHLSPQGKAGHVGTPAVVSGLFPLLLHALLFGDHVPCRIS